LGKYRNQPKRESGHDGDLRLIGPVTIWCCEFRGRGGSRGSTAACMTAPLGLQ